MALLDRENDCTDQPDPRLFATFATTMLEFQDGDDLALENEEEPRISTSLPTQKEKKKNRTADRRLRE